MKYIKLYEDNRDQFDIMELVSFDKQTLSYWKGYSDEDPWDNLDNVHELPADLADGHSIDLACEEILDFYSQETPIKNRKIVKQRMMALGELFLQYEQKINAGILEAYCMQTA